MQRLLFVAVLIALGWLTPASAQEVSVTISTPTASVAVGKPIPLQVQLKNISGHEIRAGEVVGHNQAELNYIVTMLDSKGRPVPPTSYGTAARSRHVMIISEVAKRLGPGQALAQHTELAKLFEITEPGNYTVRVGRIWPPSSKNVVWSNTLTLTMTK